MTILEPDGILGNLPVPRLELRLKRIDPPEDGYTAVWYLLLVLRHLEGYVYEMELSQTRTDAEDLMTTKVPRRPFRAEAQILHDACSLRLQAYYTRIDGDPQQLTYCAPMMNALHLEPGKLSGLAVGVVPLREYEREWKRRQTNVWRDEP